ncbi:MAG: nucleoside phosphorylase [Clostridia bacterium]|nr:nucleoside phosphorylase [Clostridia bacterium]MBQ4084947.1 nucleoside phosphorylase [Clostridia bacterium]
MRWKIEGDATRPVITPEEHVRSAHGGEAARLPEICVLFEMGMALPFIEKNWDTVSLSDRLPCFIADSRAIALRERPQVCFVNGGYGAPAAVDTLETIRALGVRQVLVVGMCGGFAREINVGDVVVPERILCEEGTSFHYADAPQFALPNGRLRGLVCERFAADWRIWDAPTVTSDAFYRQTFAKEEAWRQAGCAAVDMEASALLNAAAFHGMPAAAVLLCSDKHPMREDEPRWRWGSGEFGEKRRKFVRAAVELAMEF